MQSHLVGSKRGVVLIADDSESDRDIILRALEKGRIKCTVKEVENGEQLLKYLRREAPYDDEKLYPWPNLLLLDINMPRIDGKQALRELRQLPQGKMLPVVMLTTSARENDIAESYALGVNGYITKPVENKKFMDTIAKLEFFWFGLVMLPPRMSEDLPSRLGPSQ